MNVPLVEQNVYFLRQGAELLENLPEGVYRPDAAGGVRRSGIGPQFRHCLDFFRCLLRDLEEGRIDYDRRERRGRIEEDRRAALAEVEEIVRSLRALGPDRMESPLVVRNDLAPGEEPETAWNRSTVGRELRFLASHTVHHYALIAVLLRQRGVEPGESFGVAPATVAHWQEQ